MQMQLSRLKEQMDHESEERLGAKSEESRSQEQSRRLQRQVRELEEELADVRRKESESSQRKLDVVCAHITKFWRFSYSLNDIFTAHA